MKLTVTEQNYKHVAGLLKKSIKRSIESQFFYPSTKRRNNILNQLGLKKGIQKSGKSRFEQVVIEPDYMHEKKFIRIHNNLDVCGLIDDDFDSKYRAFIVYCGDTVTFKGNAVYIKSLHPTIQNEKAVRIITKN